MGDRTLPAEKPVFDSPQACLKDLESKIWKVPYGSGQRKGERQHQCRACGRWKYADERCNWFDQAPPPPGPKEPPQPKMKEVG